jgi:hypothetical protein
MRRSRVWLGTCAVVAALAWPGASAAQAATPTGGVGTFLLVSAGSVTAGTATTVEFRYTAPAKWPSDNLTVTVDLPPGWTATAPATCGAGCQVGTAPGTSPQLVVKMNLNAAQETFTLDYPATPPESAGPSPFTAMEEFGTNAATTFPTLTVTVTCPDGAGRMSVYPLTMTPGASTDLRFTYTAGECGVQAGGEVAVIVPGQWPPPAPGSVTWSGSSPPEESGPMIMVPVGSVGAGASVVFYYNAARAPASPGGYPFDAFEQSSAAGPLQALAVSPQVTVTASVVTTSAPGSAITSAPGSAITSAPGSASGGAVSPSVAAGGGGTSPPGSARRVPIALVGFGVGGLGLLGLVVALGAARAVSHRRHWGDHAAGGGNVQAVPRIGPPPSVTVRDTGTRPALTVRIEPRVGATVTEIEEKRP